jgi:hypothetical protein
MTMLILGGLEMSKNALYGNMFVTARANHLCHFCGKWKMVLHAKPEEGGLRGYHKTMPPAFIIKGDIPLPDFITQ